MATSSASADKNSFGLRRVTEGSRSDAEICLGLTESVGWHYTIDTWRQWVHHGCFLFSTTPEGQDSEDGKDGSDSTSSEKVVGISCTFPQGALATVGATITLPEYRGKGLATKLIRGLFDFARSQPTASGQPIRSLVLNGTESGRPVYRRLGFKEYGWILTVKGSPAPVADLATPESHLSSSPSLKLHMGGESLSNDVWEQFIQLEDEATELDRRSVCEMSVLSADQTSSQTSKTLLPGSRHAYIVDESTSRMTAFASTRKMRSQWIIAPIVASSPDQAVALLSALLTEVHANIQKAVSSGDTKVTLAQFDVDEAVDPQGTLQKYAENQWGLKVHRDLQLMEYLLDDAEREAGGAVGPAELFNRRLEKGEKKGPLQYAIADLSVM
ncbi:hypothetical protein BCV69DRAFT_312527 [Microstroma glucosiphilum]|uniref:N-acetyltransferase domain-containing protein n=1 Tax=Pseudomicrostroma glucosiphilum TaxID=1684307 RepID=A0A316U5T2_9BASI|nr:hypothetical protein BCV69DRAFT_312527 [Pseudomicrostroma glucosiphilum]PWN20572.1 hypothetical protein BCV69DRAFT_312527 [Pseudomicrostroma glucosiphilum]